MESLSSDEAVNMQFELVKLLIIIIMRCMIYNCWLNLQFQEYVQLISEESSSVPESVENSRFMSRKHNLT